MIRRMRRLHSHYFIPVTAVFITLVVAACSHIPGLGPSAVASDSIMYQVIGSPGTGNGAVTYNTPTTVVPATVNLNGIWQSGVIAGYGQFIAQKPSITVTAYGCVTAQVLINANVVETKTGCGQPITVSAQH